VKLYGSVHEFLVELIEDDPDFSKRTSLRIAIYRGLLKQRKALFDWYWKCGGFTKADFLAFFTKVYVPLNSSGIPEQYWGFRRDLLRTYPGRPWPDEKWLLLADYVVLSISRNRYLHLLRDSLKLKLRPLPSTSEKLGALSKSINWSETTCRRVWNLCRGEPPPTPPTDWWVEPARIEIGGRALNRAIAANFLSDVRKLRNASSRA